MSAPTVVEFLLARIAEDEAAAKAASPGPWFREYSDVVTLRPDPRDVEEGYDDPRDARVVRGAPHLPKKDRQGIADAEYITRYSPPRVLAECAAKRAIIKQHEEWPVLVEREPVFSHDPLDAQSMTMRMTREIAWLTEREYVKRFGVEPPTTPMIRALAAVYKDHPSYQQEWSA